MKIRHSSKPKGLVAAPLASPTRNPIAEAATRIGSSIGKSIGRPYKKGGAVQRGKKS